MAENNDEYQFADLDAITPDTPIEPESEFDSPPEKNMVQAFVEGIVNNPVMRNALIAIGALFTLIILYKIITSFFIPTKVNVTTLSQPTVISKKQTETLTPEITEPVVEQKIEQKLSALEVTQDSIKSDVSTVNTQVGTINDNVNALVEKVNQLSTIVTNLTTKVDTQAQEIDRMRIRQVKTYPAHHAKIKRVHYPTYYLKAVIPGRAWLIGSNGSTLTVRDGTVIPGYGTVRLIDPNQGKVATSSGRVIRFSQEDS